MGHDEMIDGLLVKTREQMNEKRFQHTLAVRETALELAQRFQVDPVQAEVAAILHDYCKYWPRERMEAVIRQSERTPQTLLTEPVALWHAHVAAEVLPQECNIDDEAVLMAIRYHTTGRPGMTPLEQVIFLADYIEPHRDFTGVEKVRQLAQFSLEKAVFATLKQTLLYLLNKEQSIHIDTVLAYNYFLQKQKSEVEK